MAADGGCETDVVHRMNWVYRASGALKSVVKNRGQAINATKCLYDGVIVPTVSYRAEAWGMRSAERRRVTVLSMKCLEVWLECREWIELGMKRCVGEQV